MLKNLIFQYSSNFLITMLLIMFISIELNTVSFSSTEDEQMDVDRSDKVNDFDWSDEEMIEQEELVLK